MAVQELALITNHRGMSLPQLIGPKLERVKRCPRDCPTHSVMQMQVVTVYNERKSKLAGLVWRCICAICGLDVTKSWWETKWKVVENHRTKILWDFEFQADKQLLPNWPHILVIDKKQKKVLINVATSGQHHQEEGVQENREMVGAEGTIGADVECKVQSGIQNWKSGSTRFKAQHQRVLSRIVQPQQQLKYCVEPSKASLTNWHVPALRGWSTPESLKPYRDPVHCAYWQNIFPHNEDTVGEHDIFCQMDEYLFISVL